MANLGQCVSARIERQTTLLVALLVDCQSYGLQLALEKVLVALLVALELLLLQKRRLEVFAEHSQFSGLSFADIPV